MMGGLLELWAEGAKQAKTRVGRGAEGTEYVILFAFPLQQWLRERASMLRYTYSTLAVLLISLFKV